VADYTSYQFLYPPRPEKAIFSIQLPYYEQRNFIVQYKKNGTNNGMAISPRCEITAMQRRNEPHALWAPSEHTKEAFRDLPGGWYYFVAELLHSKVSGGAAKGLRDINYINDILVADDKHLVGTTFAERQALLAKLFNAAKLPISSTGSHYIIDSHTWLARNHTKSFAQMFAGLREAEDEGLVLKMPSAKLAPCTKPTANASWMVKIRMPHKNYAA
jgi:hypothetical protein